MKKVIITPLLASLLNGLLSTAHVSIISSELNIQQTEISKAAWLIGIWENKTSRGSIYESWIVRNENEFFGRSYIVKEQDTLVFESIQLIQKQEGLLYIPTVKNQNEGQPVVFKPKSITENQLVFENPEHDFPQLISYTKISSDSLVAIISGIKNGQERQQRFPMKRIK